MRVSWGNDRLAQIFARCFKRKTVGDLEWRGQKTFRKDFLNHGSGFWHRGKRCREGGTRRRKRKQSQSDLGNNAEHSFGPDEEADQIEAGLVFVNTTAGSQNVAACEHDFQACYVIARHAIF